MARPIEIIDLVSDSEDEEPAPAPAAAAIDLRASPEEDRDLDGDALFNDDGLFADYFPMPGPFNDGPAMPAMPAMGDLADVPLVIDDFGYLDEDPQQQAGADQEERDLELARSLDAGQVLSEDDCLARVYEMFPDVCPEHASTLYAQIGEENELPAAVRLDRIIEKLLTSGPYPKRKKEPQLKRKREESVDLDSKRWEGDDREDIPGFLKGSIRAILKAEFPTFTQASIHEILQEDKYLYKSYVRLAKLRDTDATIRRGRPPVGNSNAVTIAENSGWPLLMEELTAARKRAQADRDIRMEEATKKRAEDDNLRRAIAQGQTAECQACFDDLPMNRQVHCDGDTPHFTCFSCIETYIKTEIGDSRCRVLCTAGCGSGFEPAQLNLISDKKILQKLADLQQEKDIRDANLEDLEECPFCDYKAIMPPIEVNFEFQCANVECEKVSCRRCKAASHIPISCEQYAKDKKANSRHTIEEAMTAALIRSCNKCKKQFIKEYGCNKMTCPSCGNLQCYICSETLKGYEHFSQHPGGEARPGGKCPLYDNLEARHEREVKAAEEAARAQVVANNPEVTAEDLEIKMSDAVKKSTEDRIRRAGPEGLGGGPMGFGGVGGVAFDQMFGDLLPQINANRHLGALPAGGRGRGRANNAGHARAAQRDEEQILQQHRLLRQRLQQEEQLRLEQRLREQPGARGDDNARPAAHEARRRRREAVAEQVRRRNIAPPRFNVDIDQNVPNAAPAQHQMQLPNPPWDFLGDPFGAGADDAQRWPEPPGFAGVGAARGPQAWRTRRGGHFVDAAGAPLHQPAPNLPAQQQALNVLPAENPALLGQQQLAPFQRGPVPDGFLPRANDIFWQMPAHEPPQQGFGAADQFADVLREAEVQRQLNMPLNPAGRVNVMHNLHQLEFLRQQNDARNANRIANARAAGMGNQQRAGLARPAVRD